MIKYRNITELLPSKNNMVTVPMFVKTLMRYVQDARDVAMNTKKNHVAYHIVQDENGCYWLAGMDKKDLN